MNIASEALAAKLYAEKIELTLEDVERLCATDRIGAEVIFGLIREEKHRRGIRSRAGRVRTEIAFEVIGIDGPKMVKAFERRRRRGRDGV